MDSFLEDRQVSRYPNRRSARCHTRKPGSAHLTLLTWTGSARNSARWRPVSARGAGVRGCRRMVDSLPRLIAGQGAGQRLGDPRRRLTSSPGGSAAAEPSPRRCCWGHASSRPVPTAGAWRMQPADSRVHKDVPCNALLSACEWADGHRSRRSDHPYLVRAYSCQPCRKRDTPTGIPFSGTTVRPAWVRDQPELLLLALACSAVLARPAEYPAAVRALQINPLVPCCYVLFRMGCLTAPLLAGLALFVTLVTTISCCPVQARLALSSQGSGRGPGRSRTGRRVEGGRCACRDIRPSVHRAGGSAGLGGEHHHRRPGPHGRPATPGELHRQAGPRPGRGQPFPVEEVLISAEPWRAVATAEEQKPAADGRCGAERGEADVRKTWHARPSLDRRRSQISSPIQPPDYALKR